jgi:hypothetical protein
MLDIQISLSDLAAIRAELRAAPKLVDTAMRRAINRTLVTGRTQISKRVRQETPLKAGTVRARLRIVRASQNALVGLIEVLGRGIPLIEFRARQTRRGVTYSIRRGQRELLKSAFIRETATRGRQVLRRAPDSRTNSGLVGRLPIYMQYGPDLATLVEKLIPNIQLDLTEVLRTNFGRELDFALNRGR